MRVARRRMVRAFRALVAFITCAKEAEHEVVTLDAMDAHVERIRRWKRGGSVTQVRKLLTTVNAWLRDETSETLWGKHFQKTQGSFLLPAMLHVHADLQETPPIESGRWPPRHARAATATVAGRERAERRAPVPRRVFGDARGRLQDAQARPARRRVGAFCERGE